jgi:hypothetical protein
VRGADRKEGAVRPETTLRTAKKANFWVVPEEITDETGVITADTQLIRVNNSEGVKHKVIDDESKSIKGKIM